LKKANSWPSTRAAQSLLIFQEGKDSGQLNKGLTIAGEFWANLAKVSLAALVLLQLPEPIRIGDLLREIPQLVQQGNRQFLQDFVDLGDIG
jgi:hypothetical protein